MPVREISITYLCLRVIHKRDPGENAKILPPTPCYPRLFLTSQYPLTKDIQIDFFIP